MHGVIFFADDIPARLRLPGSSPDFRLEQVGFGDTLSRPNQLLLLLRKVSAEIFRSLRPQPDTPIYDFDLRKDIRPREVRLLCLRCFIGIRSERADVNQAGNAIVDYGASDDTSAIGVTDEDDGAADPANRCLLLK